MRGLTPTTAYGGANLKKLSVCEVYYGFEKNERSHKIMTSVVSREKDQVVWTANLPLPLQQSELYFRTTFYTNELIGHDTTVYWNIELNNLSNEYKDFIAE